MLSPELPRDPYMCERQTQMPAMIKGITAAATLGLFVFAAGAALAQPQTIHLASSNSWVANEHRASQNSPPDTCVSYADQPPYMFGMRLASGEMFGTAVQAIGTEVAFSDKNWSLPPGVRGPIMLSIGTYDLSLEVTANTSDMVLAPITGSNLRGLIAAMHNASSMTVTPGNGIPATISLLGSNVATTAFRICAGIAGPAVGGQPVPFNKTTNPFQ